MKTVKKWIAFMLTAGLIVSVVKVTAMTVSAETYEKCTAPTSCDTEGYKDGDYWHVTGGCEDEWYVFKDGSWQLRNIEEEIASWAAAEAEKAAASDEGFLEATDMYRAAEKNMSAGEYYNNVVISTPGIENAVTVGQGGNLVVNGVVTNMTAMISKVTNRAYVDSVRVNEPKGRLLNVVQVSYPAFDATINFYMPSVTAEMDIVALQYSEGTWVNVDVADIREDHVVLNMKKSGIVAFVAKETIAE